MRIVIAEDSAVIRAGLVGLLTDRGHEVVAAVGDGEALRTAVEDHRPDIAIVDVRMPPTHTDEGLRAAMAIRAQHPGFAVLMFSHYIETGYAAHLLGAAGDRAAQGVGYLLKDRVTDVDAFDEALERVAAGGVVVDPEVIAQLLRAGRRADAVAELTEREHEVLALAAQGRSNHAIATGLGISERAVQKHISTVFTKLGLPRSEADHRRVLAVLRYLRP
jgi:DNA-binding NarL/FixJ family response regulator